MGISRFHLSVRPKSHNPDNRFKTKRSSEFPAGPPRSAMETIVLWAAGVPRLSVLVSPVLMAAACLFSLSAPARANPADDRLFEAIRVTDAAAAAIGFRLATANASLCDRLEPGLGLVLHTPEQYAPGLRGTAVQHFSLDGPVGVEAVIPGSPAARAGIAPGDVLSGVGAEKFAPPAAQAEATTAFLVDITRRIAALPVDGTVAVHGRRRGSDFAIAVNPLPACRTRFEVQFGKEFTAQADGEMVQLSSRFLAEFPADQVAAVLAHELAHNILHHRERLEAQGVPFGMMSNFGKASRLFRQTEIEADILSVSLLANAGLDPSAAVRFWRAFGPEHSEGLFRGRSHPDWRDRVATIEKAIAGLGPRRPDRPSILDTRATPLDGDWQSLLVKAH